MIKNISDYKPVRLIVYALLAMLWFVPELDIFPLCVIVSIGIILLELTRTGGSIYASGFSLDKISVSNSIKTVLIFFVSFSIFPIVFLCTDGYFTYSPPSESNSYSLAMTVFSYAFWEELMFRGSFFKELIENNNGVVWTLTISFFFAIAHLGNPNVTTLGLISIFASGILFSFLYIRTKSIYAPTIFHFLWNWSQSYILGFSTSGYYVSDSVLTPIISDNRINQYLFSSCFGLEGSVLSVLVLLVALLLSAKCLKASPMANSVVLRRKYLY